MDTAGHEQLGQLNRLHYWVAAYAALRNGGTGLRRWRCACHKSYEACILSQRPGVLGNDAGFGAGFKEGA